MFILLFRLDASLQSLFVILTKQLTVEQKQRFGIIPLVKTSNSNVLLSNILEINILLLSTPFHFWGVYLNTAIDYTAVSDQSSQSSIFQIKHSILQGVRHTQSLISCMC